MSAIYHMSFFGMLECYDMNNLTFFLIPFSTRATLVSAFLSITKLEGVPRPPAYVKTLFQIEEYIVRQEGPKKGNMITCDPLILHSFYRICHLAFWP